VFYISVARHISDGAGFVGYDGDFFVLEPPLYPVILAGIKKMLFIDPLLSAGYLNAILSGLVIYFSGLLLSMNLKSFQLIILGTISVLASFVFIQIFLNALSEPLFIFFVLLYLYYFNIYRVRGAVSSLLLFSTATALACLTRYVGVILILTGSISILVWGTNTLKSKFSHILIFMIMAILPTGLWIFRNYFLTGTLVGQRAGSSYTLFENIIFLFDTVLRWYLPVQLNGTQLFFIIIISAVIFTGIVFVNSWKKGDRKLNQIAPVIIFVLFYSGIIVVSSTTTAYDRIGDRLMSPVFVPLLIIVFLFLDIILNKLSKYFHHWPVSDLFIIGIILWLEYPVLETIREGNDYVQKSGWGYGGKAWKDNSVINYLIKHKNLKTGNSFYSNAPEAVYILANKGTNWSPFKTFYNSPQPVNLELSLNSISKLENKDYLIWFNNIDRNCLYTIEELRKRTNMSKVVQLKDGEIYTIAGK